MNSTEESGWKLAPRFWVNEETGHFLDVGYNRKSLWKATIQQSRCRKVAFVLQRDPSGAASCQGCGSKISKFSLRIGIPEKDPRGPCGVLPRWHHASYRCLTPNRPWCASILKEANKLAKDEKAELYTKPLLDWERPVHFGCRKIVLNALQKSVFYLNEFAEQSSCGRLLTRRALVTDVISEASAFLKSMKTDELMEWGSRIKDEIVMTNALQLPTHCHSLWKVKISDDVIAAAILWIYRKNRKENESPESFPLVMKRSVYVKESSLMKIKDVDLFNAISMAPVVLDTLEYRLFLDLVESSRSPVVPLPACSDQPCSFLLPYEEEESNPGAPGEIGYHEYPTLEDLPDPVEGEDHSKQYGALPSAFFLPPLQLLEALLDMIDEVFFIVNGGQRAIRKCMTEFTTADDLAANRSPLSCYEFAHLLSLFGPLASAEIVATKDQAQELKTIDAQVQVRAQELSSRLPPFPVSPLLKATLLPFQLEGYRWMKQQEQSTVRGGVLADEMGMGKTVQSIALITGWRIPLEKHKDLEAVQADNGEFWAPALSNRGPLITNGGTLIVAPLAAIVQWQNEIHKFIDLDHASTPMTVMIYHGCQRKSLNRLLHTHDVIITTYEILEADYRACINRQKLQCPYCSRLFMEPQLRLHLTFYCGPNAARTAKQSLRETNPNNVQLMAAMRTMDIGGGDDEDEIVDADDSEDPDVELYESNRSAPSALPSLSNVYKGLMKEAGREVSGSIPWYTSKKQKVDEILKEEQLAAGVKVEATGVKIEAVLEGSEVKLEGGELKDDCRKDAVVDPSSSSNAKKRRPLRQKASLRTKKQKTIKTLGDIGRNDDSNEGDLPIVKSRFAKRAPARPTRLKAVTKNKAASTTKTKKKMSASNCSSLSSDSGESSLWIDEDDNEDDDHSSEVAVTMTGSEDEESMADPSNSSCSSSDELIHEPPRSKIDTNKKKPGREDSVSTAIDRVIKVVTVDASRKDTKNTKKAVVAKKGREDLTYSPEEWLDTDLSDSPLHVIQWGRVILDEAHRIKSRSTGRSQAVAHLVRGGFRWGLSGTPVQNRIGELYSLIKFVELEPYAFYECRKAGCGCKHLYQRVDPSTKCCFYCSHSLPSHSHIFNRDIANPITKNFKGRGVKALRLLREDVLDKMILRRTKVERKDDLSLNPLVVRIRRDQLSEKERDFYESLYKQSKVKFDAYAEEGTVLHNYAHIFDLLSRLRQAADHPFLIVHNVPVAIPAPSRAAFNQIGTCGVCQDTLLVECSDIITAFGGIDDNLESKQDDLESKQDFDIENSSASTSRGDVLTEPLMMTLNCHHYFHKSCLSEYLDEAEDLSALTCPVCFQDLTVDLRQSTRSVIEYHYKGFESEALSKASALMNQDSTVLEDSITENRWTEMNSLKKSNGSLISRINTDKFVSSTKVEAFIEEYNKALEEDPDFKGIVFSQYCGMLELMEWRLRKAGVGCARMVGSMPLQTRVRVLQSFNADPEFRIILISLKAGGEGLNLQVASRVYLMDPWWNPAGELQAIQRAHRIGQTKEVVAVRFIAELTIEEKILELQRKKQLAFECTIGGKASSSVAKLTTEDLKFLFQIS
eukprot:GHVH01004579.1.p1 GENE.GHVH01004579.1~~GHVH01004579.1.p1  ORF type:complete len:1585 (-),score=291.24 GHVH01004579.1:249-5003(-)